MSMIIHPIYGLLNEETYLDFKVIREIISNENSLNIPYIELEGFTKRNRGKAGARQLEEELRVEYTALVCKILKI